MVCELHLGPLSVLCEHELCLLVLLLVEGIVDGSLHVVPEWVAGLLLLILDLDILEIDSLNLLDSHMEHIDLLVPLVKGYLNSLQVLLGFFQSPLLTSIEGATTDNGIVCCHFTKV